MYSFNIIARRASPLIALVALVAGCCDGCHPAPPGSTPTPSETPIPTETPTCAMAFTNPAPGAALPPVGGVDFIWTNIPAASYYLLQLTVPGGVQPTSYTVHGNKRTIYMESFSIQGNFTAMVQARSPSADILCQASMAFSVQPPQPKSHKAPNPGTTPGLPPPVFILPTNPPPPQ